MGENLLKITGLRPNWDEHDAATCPIINYFANRKNTALILTKQETQISKDLLLLQDLHKLYKTQRMHSRI